MARTAAGSRSGMDEYELHGHLSEKLFRAIGNYFANFFATDCDASLGQEIFNITVTQIESKVEPDCVANDIGWGAPSRKRWRL